MTKDPVSPDNCSNRGCVLSTLNIEQGAYPDVSVQATVNAGLYTHQTIEQITDLTCFGLPCLALAAFMAYARKHDFKEVCA